MDMRWPEEGVSELKCEQLAGYFTDKIDRIWVDLNSGLMRLDLDSRHSGPILWDRFELLQPGEVDRLLGEITPTTCVLDPGSASLVRVARGGLKEWFALVINGSLQSGELPIVLKEAIIRTLK